MEDPIKDSGLFIGIKRWLATALEIAHVRLDLLGTELQIEKHRIFSGLIWGAFALMLLGVGLVLFCGFILLLFWDSYRLAATGSLSLLFISGAYLVMREAKQRLSQPSSLFKSSLDELKKDRSALQTSASK